MAATDRQEIADRIRMLSLHGMSRDAWGRLDRGGSWDYEILEAGHKYNLTDIAAALGLAQLQRAGELWKRRCRLAARYAQALADVEELELPVEPPDRRSSWHLFPVRLRLERLGVTRDAVIDRLRERGVGTSVHWRPLPLQPYYRNRGGFSAETFPLAAREFLRLVSLPLFPDMKDSEQDYVVRELRSALASGEKPSG
jgi:perosamine synthetase